MLGLILGPVAIMLGLKGFRASGIPLTSRRRITGKPAQIIGSFCVSVGALMFVGGIYSALRLFMRLAETSG